mgnify:CR=1 FL=1
MLKKLSVTAVILAMSAMLLVPTAYAVQPVDAPEQEEENCIKTLLELLAGDTEKNESARQESLFRKNGFKIQDGRLYHYTDGQLDVYQPGFVQIGDDVYHVSVTSGSFDLYPAGFVTIDGKLYHVSKNGYSIDRYAEGLHEIDGGMYYVKEDGSFLTNSAVGYLTFDANGRYTSGNATLDSYVDQALAACTNSGMTEAQKLRAAYLYVRDHGAYLARPHQARGTTAWAEESALFMFEHKKGNCYCFAGQFLYMARRLGYNAYVVSGGVGRKDSDHAWVMICENGVPYIYDVELEWGYSAGRYGHAEYNMYKMPLNKTVFSYQFP